VFIIATFYHFFDFPDFAEKRATLLAELRRLDIKGSLLIASEGINGTLAGSREAIDSYLDYLKEHIVKNPFEHKESRCDRQPFGRSKVRIKKEIISLGEATPSLALALSSPLPLAGGARACPREGGEGGNLSAGSECVDGFPHPASPVNGGGEGRVGRYVEPKDWNALIADPDTLVIDARNAYEVHLGTFERAIDPNTRNFKQLPAFVRQTLDPAQHKKIATFCTGGIRCEKFSSWLLDQGFAEVYQLKGGILKYLEEMPAAASRWQGECYVFDERIAVGHGLAPSQTASMCPACGHPLKEEERIKDQVPCPYCPPAFQT